MNTGQFCCTSNRTLTKEGRLALRLPEAQKWTSSSYCGIRNNRTTSHATSRGIIWRLDLVSAEDVLKGKLALIVEDEAAMAQIIADILRQHGYQAQVLQRGSGACDWVRENKPDLVLLDLMLPDRDGFSICEELKLDRQTNLIPVIMVTALARHDDVVRGLRVGANFYLTKPFSIDQLIAAIDQVLTWRRDMERCGACGEIQFQINSDTRYLEQLNGMLSALFLHTGMSEDDIYRLNAAVREMGNNAIEWGHRKQVDRLVTVTYRIDAEKVEICIRDTGEGFKPQCIKHVARDDDPIGHMDLREKLGLRAGGFGIMLTKGMVDELCYNEQGNEVKLVKKLGGTT